MVRIAVTGGIACGKSRVGALLVERGVPVCDTDGVAHSLMAAGQPVCRKITEYFGREIIAKDGSVDRRRLARRVFKDPEQLRQLNRMTHPAVMRKVRKWLREQEASGCRITAVLIPLLFEAGFEKQWDAVVCVAAPRKRQVAWLKSRGLGSGAAGIRIASQMPLVDKMVRADYVVYNSGSVEVLRQQVDRIIDSISGE